MKLRIVSYKEVFVIFCMAYMFYFVYAPGLITKTLLFCILSVLAIGKSPKGKSFYAVIVFSLSYAFFSYINGDYSEFARFLFFLVSPICFYIYGCHVVDKSESEESIIDSLILITSLFCFPVLNAAISSIITTKSFVNPTRILNIAGDDSIIISSTLIGLNITTSLAGLPLILDKQLSKIRKIMLVGLSVLGLLTTIYLVNRTGLLVVLFSFLVVAIYYSQYNSKNALKIIIAVIAIVFICLSTNIISPDIIDAYSNRSIDNNTMGDRSWRWMDALGNIFTHPLGWAFLHDGEFYVHNMWLDIDRIAGFVPFVTLLYITIQSTLKLFKLRYVYSGPLYAYLVSLNSCCLMSAFVEPVTSGFPMFLFMYCLIVGIIDKYCDSLESKSI